jgi:hypothetical protein
LIGLINAIGGLIEEVSKFKNQFKSKLQGIKVQEPKWIVIEALKGLIDFIMVNLKELRVWRVNWLKKFETKDYFARNAEIQESNCIISGVKLK